MSVSWWQVILTSPFQSSGERNGFTPSPQLPFRAGLCWSVLQQCVMFPEQANQWLPLKSLHLVIKSVHLVPCSFGLAGRSSLRAVSTSGTVGESCAGMWGPLVFIFDILHSHLGGRLLAHIASLPTSPG